MKRLVPSYLLQHHNTVLMMFFRLTAIVTIAQIINIKGNPNTGIEKAAYCEIKKERLELIKVKQF